MVGEAAFHAVVGRLELVEREFDDALSARLVRALGAGASTVTVPDDARATDFTVFVDDAPNLVEALSFAVARIDDALQSEQLQFRLVQVEALTAAAHERRRLDRTEQSFVGQRQAAEILKVNEAGLRLLGLRADFPESRYRRADMVAFSRQLDREQGLGSTRSPQSPPFGQSL